MKPAVLRLTTRARRNIEDCIAFVGCFPTGKPERRRREIYPAFQQICDFPEGRPIEIRRRRSGLALRRYHVSQFTIVYAYLPPVATRPWAIVTVRAVQHRRIRNVFFGVREESIAPGSAGYRTV